MTDPHRPGRSDQAPEPGPPERLRQPYPLHTDPTYVGQTPYWPAYEPAYLSAPGPNLTESNPTERLPRYWQQGQPPGEPPPQAVPPPQGPKPPRWLWIAAGAALLLVVALLIALVIANGSAKKQTAVAPLPAMPQPSSTATPPATTSSPSSTATAPPTTSPTATTGAAAMQTVVYNVIGEGRAISITYADSGGVRQTEFNVALPWSKEVSLSTQDTASVTIINIGHDVTCSVTIAGARVRQHTGVGLTVCSTG
jgi:hypothetical protein